jgi:hypothetical protein
VADAAGTVETVSVAADDALGSRSRSRSTIWHD